MKKGTILLLIATFCVGFFGLIGVKALLVKEPKLETSIIQIATITEISEGTSNDIVLTDSQGDTYYIKSGFDHGLNLDSLSAKVLNKTVTLHLPKLLFGTSEHIAQLAVNDVIIFTKFSSESESSED